MKIVEVNKLTKEYHLYKTPLARLGEVFSVRKKSRHTTKFALNNVSFSINSGETVGIIGKNGSGKSSLLKILSGIVIPTHGTVNILGKVSALIELGAGFNPEYTGRENIYMSEALIGRSKAETEINIGEIIEFADIGIYLDQPTKNYSSGMLVRLAFAVAINAKPEVLLVDEALAVGDYRFQAKCYNKFNELKQSGVTIIFVSHDVDAVRKTCDRVIWLDNGSIKMDGDVRLVTAKYMEFSVNMHENSLLDNKFTNRFGTHMGSIKNVKLSAENFKINDEISVFVELDVPKGINLTHAGVSVSVKNRSGLDLFVVATSDMNIKFNRTGFACINIKFLNIFNADEYAIAVGFEKRDEIPIKYYDYIEDACIFRSISDHEMFGLVHINAKIEVMQ